MKKKTLGRIALCGFALCMVSTAVASKTLAAFYDQIEGEGTITVADFTNLTFEKDETNLTAAFDLADTKDANLNVMEGTIAPGDTGSFEIVLGASEVEYTYTLVINPVTAVEGKTVPIKFYSDPEMIDANLFEDVTDVGVALATNASATGKQTIPVYWQWVTEEPAVPGDPDNDIDYKDIHTTFTVDLSASQADVTIAP